MWVKLQRLARLVGGLQRLARLVGGWREGLRDIPRDIRGEALAAQALDAHPSAKTAYTNIVFIALLPSS